MSNTTYDILNKIQRWLPAVGVLYLGLCKIWGFAFGSEVNDTIVIVATFLATTLEIFSSKFYKEHDLTIVPKK